ncbi:catechol o methyltransferase [Metschnikowia bicuspidata var. bicuspidata NRRL YB-4993]|uniref:catechol O-methyltransferase n=1 Tax=Metschnikowia bicuspidata var. bicuspidata NRRL YB-4993 TaxID=869754 RepID=A0A1A0HEM7_9ASCO|nr:catechol o methyltransferase [Metschnikowia bicuspidata var. bicuspidata NRRL YB-4993]OBA22425.1 catechol o methyltransferase [Metschnikowia bicuspidata var. bicuspidata NRRL YB-4993]
MEQQVLQHVLSTPGTKGSPEKVLQAIDEFAQKRRLMIVGRQKGLLVLDAIREKEPAIMVELGCYVGYSAILFGAELATQNEKYSENYNTPARYYSFEICPEFAAVARQMVEHAGLSGTVEIIVGPAGRTLPQFQHRLKEQFHKYTPVDVVFVDHAKELYVPDFRVLESQGLIAPDTVIVADNIFLPGAPDYVQYVQSSPEYRRDHNQRTINVSNAECEGRWNLLYDSRTVPVEDPETGRRDAVEITRCVSYLSG